MRIALIILLLAATPSFAQEDKAFPAMEAESLTHNMVSIPKDIEGKYSLICLAYSKRSEEDLGQWFSPIYNNFIRQSSDLFRINYDINTYFIPMFTGAKRPAYKKTMKKVQESVDPLIQPHVLFFEGTMAEYKKKLELDEADIPYFFILNPEGKIIHTARGKYTDKKMQEIVNALAPSLK